MKTTKDHLRHIERNTVLIMANRKHLLSGDDAFVGLAEEINRELMEANDRRWGEVLKP